MAESIIIKTYISRLDGTNTIHRFRGSFDYDQLHAVVNHLIGNNTTEDAVAAAIAGRTGAKNGFTMEYVDEDGDKVCISCGLEWNEALQQHAEAAEASGKKEPIKIYVTEKGQQAPSATASSASFVVVPTPSDSTASPVVVDTVPSAKGTNEVLAKTEEPLENQPQNATKVVEETKMNDVQNEPLEVHVDPRVTDASNKTDVHEVSSDDEEQDQVDDDDGSDLDDDNSRCGTPEADFEYFDEDDNGDATTSGAHGGDDDLSSIEIKPKFTKEMPKLADFKKAMDVADAVFRCKVEDELRNENTKVDFGGLITRRFEKTAKTVSVEVNLSHLYRQALVMSNSFLNDHHMKEGEALLLKLGALFPRDPLVDYNIACVACMMGNAERAIFSLETAVEHGYTDATTMASDPELALVREDRRVINLINRLNGFWTNTTNTEKAAFSGTKPGKGDSVLKALHEPMPGSAFATNPKPLGNLANNPANSGTLGNGNNNNNNNSNQRGGITNSTSGSAPFKSAFNTQQTNSTNDNDNDGGAKSNNTTTSTSDYTGGDHGNKMKQNVRIMENMFPDLQPGKAKALLKKHNNNVDAAVNELLLSL